jgi:hypothetical protein
VAADGLDDLIVQIRATAEGWASDVKAIQRNADQLDKSLRPLQTQAKNIGLALSAMGAATGIALVGAAKATAEYGSQINKMSIQTGIAAEQLSKVKFAADQSETSFEGVAQGLKFLARNAAEAAAGSKAQAEAFRSIGIAVRDSSGALRPMNDLLLDVADQFKGMEDGTAKAALAQKIFGRSGLDLIPILNEGREGILRMGNEAERLGLVMSGDAARAADEFDDMLTAVKASTLGLAVAVGQALLPSLTSVAGTLRDGIAEITSFAKEHENATLAIGGLAAVITGAGGLAAGLALVVSIAPKVAAGLHFIAQGAVAAAGSIGAMATALTVLQGVRTYGDVAAGISLIWESSLAAKAGIVGLTSALSVGIGSLVNYLIEGTKLRSVLDDIGRNVYAATIGYGTISKAQREAAAATQKLSDDLAKQGIIVERGTDEFGEWNKRVIDAAKSAATFKNALKGSAELATELSEMRDFFETRSSGTAKSTGEILKENFEKAQEAAKKLRAEIKDLWEDLKRTAEFWVRALAEFKNQTFTGGDEVKAGLAVSESMARTIIALDKEHLKLLEDAGDELIKQQQFWDAQLRDFRNRTAGGGPDVKAGEDTASRTADAIVKAAEKTKKAGQDVIDHITNDISRMFTGMIANGQSFWEAFRNLGKTAIAAVADTFLNTMIHSFLDPFAAQVGKRLSGLGIGGSFGKGDAIGIAIAGVAALGAALSSAIGQGRKEADRFVQTFQNPFGDAIKTVFDALTEAKDMGTLTVDQTQKARGEIEKLWSTFQAEAAKATHGVGQQAISTIAPLMNSWRQWLDALDQSAISSEQAAEAMKDLVDQMEALASVNADIEDTFAQLGEALNRRMDELDSQIADSVQNIEEWSRQIQDINDDISEQSATLADASHWQREYDDAIRESADQLQRLADQRKSLEGKLKDATNKAETDRLQKIIDTTTDLGTYYRTQAEMAALAQRIKDEQIAEEKSSIGDMQTELANVIRQQQEAAEAYANAGTAAAAAIEQQKNDIAIRLAADLAIRDSLMASIAAEQQRIQYLREGQQIITDLMNQAGIARTNEVDALSNSINELMYRGLLLEQERDRLIQVTGAAESASRVFAGLADTLARFTLTQSAPMPQYHAGTPYVPVTGPAMLEKGEAVISAAKNGGGQWSTMNPVFNYYGSGGKDEVRKWMMEAWKEINHAGARPLTRQGR